MSLEITIKAATREDTPFLVAMLALTLQTQPEFARKSQTEREGLAGFEIIGWQPNRDFAFVAWLSDEQQAGAVWLHAGGEVGATTFTLGIAVLPEFQGQLIGTRLMQHALAFCSQRAAVSLKLQVHPTNETAIRLYRRFGFEPTMLEMKKRLT